MPLNWGVMWLYNVHALIQKSDGGVEGVIIHVIVRDSIVWFYTYIYSNKMYNYRNKYPQRDG